MPAGLFLGLALLGTLASLSALLFFAFYRCLPSRVVSVESTTESEIPRGNAVLFSILVTYRLDGRRRTTSLSKSAYRSKRQAMRQQITNIGKFYSSGRVRFYHLPGLRSVGLLESPVIYPEVQLLAAGLLLYAVIVIGVWIFWY